MEADMEGVSNHGESIALMEPMVIPENSRHRGALADLALELASESAAFRSSLPPGVMNSLADLIRSMNCYYSNLIEGHDTHPVDIERALKNDYSSDPRKRNLQIEAKAHIAVQKWIDEVNLAGRATTVANLTEIHKRFCDNLPEDLLWVVDPVSDERHRIVPGGLRYMDVRVGRHVAVSHGAVPRFLQRFEDAYARLGKVDSVLAAASAHHRLLWIHPFMDGNGRVARLMTHAMLINALDTGGIWSAARGLARSEGRYKSHLAACDLQRRNDLDGRGNLSEETLADFTRFFLETCIDQVRFMRDLVEANRMRARILLWAEEAVKINVLPPKSGTVLEAVLYRGEVPRGDVAGIVGSTDRHARRITSALLDQGVLVSDGQRSPLRLTFSARLAARWMPGLFPEQAAPES